MLVDLIVAKDRHSPVTIFNKTVAFHHTPMVGDILEPDLFDGLGVPVIITERQHSTGGRLQCFAVED